MPRTTPHYYYARTMRFRKGFVIVQRGGLAFSIDQSYLFCETSLVASETVFHAGRTSKSLLRVGKTCRSRITICHSKPIYSFAGCYCEKVANRVLRMILWQGVGDTVLVPYIAAGNWLRYSWFLVDHNNLIPTPRCYNSLNTSTSRGRIE
ncbi:hypothetical protein B9Z19DRAFT_1075376 [Tuber borchii]|uniref:Uncharacterized protein n=1 Tax=Tuber borchii TaxID=42251 RepID=A0A2T7A3F9_TUBBO|nr:hypothetical protein B9Z19DRAFT_1075376 [Tuber borchii]